MGRPQARNAFVANLEGFLHFGTLSSMYLSAHVRPSPKDVLPMKASDIFVAALESEGVEYIFAVPGEENLGEIVSLSRNRNLRKVPGYSPGTS